MARVWCGCIERYGAHGTDKEQRGDKACSAAAWVAKVKRGEDQGIDQKWWRTLDEDGNGIE